VGPNHEGNEIEYAELEPFSLDPEFDYDAIPASSEKKLIESFAEEYLSAHKRETSNETSNDANSYENSSSTATAATDPSSSSLLSSNLASSPLSSLKDLLPVLRSDLSQLPPLPPPSVREMWIKEEEEEGDEEEDDENVIEEVQ
jgi:hypothetical protein